MICCGTSLAPWHQCLTLQTACSRIPPQYPKKCCWAWSRDLLQGTFLEKVCRATACLICVTGLTCRATACPSAVQFYPHHSVDCIFLIHSACQRYNKKWEKLPLCWEYIRTSDLHTNKKRFCLFCFFLISGINRSASARRTRDL